MSGWHALQHCFLGGASAQEAHGEPQSNSHAHAVRQVSRGNWRTKNRLETVSVSSSISDLSLAMRLAPRAGEGLAPRVSSQVFIVNL